LTLGADLERAWNHPAATAETRKRILRTVLVEIIARVDGNEIQLVLRWQGDDHSELKVMVLSCSRAARYLLMSFAFGIGQLQSVGFTYSGRWCHNLAASVIP
jgi:hypothetical protein